MYSIVITLHYYITLSDVLYDKYLYDFRKLFPLSLFYAIICYIIKIMIIIMMISIV